MWDLLLSPFQQSVFDSMDGVWQYFLDAILQSVSELLTVLLNFISELTMVPAFLQLDKYNAIGEVIETKVGLNIASDSKLSWLSDLHMYMMYIAPCVMVCILLTRIIQNLVDMGSGDSEYVPISVIFTRAFKSCAMIVVLPFAAQTVVELAAFLMAGMLNSIVDVTAQNVLEAMINAVTGESGIQGLGYSTFLLIATIGVCAFCIVYVFKISKYQIDMLIMFLTIIPAGISLCSDSHEFYNTWKSVFINLVVSQFYFVFIFAIFISAILQYFGTSLSSLMAFGSLICMFKEPELIKRIGYSSSGAKSGSMTAIRLLVSAVARV